MTLSSASRASPESGNMVEYVHMGYGSKYEHETVITVDKGFISDKAMSLLSELESQKSGG